MREKNRRERGEGSEKRILPSSALLSLEGVSFLGYSWQLPVAAEPWFVITSGGGSWQVAEPSGMSSGMSPLRVKHTQSPARPLEPTFVWPERSSFSVSTSPGKVTSCSFSQFQDIDFRARLLSPHMLSFLSGVGPRWGKIAASPVAV